MDFKSFELLRYFAENNDIMTQRSISDDTGISLGKVNAIVNQLISLNYITQDYKITELGLQTIAPYKVENAIILAAGMSTRFVPFSYEKPKGLTVVKGEVLIERQIRQLQAVGIQDIILVLGHMMEKFLYLREKFGVKIVVNNEYRYKNTHSSIYFSRDYLKNSYICCADNYFPKNVFHTYELHSLYSTVFMEGVWRGERGVFTDKNGLIIKTQRPAVDQWVMNGYAYFERSFSSKFKKILEDMYDLPGTNDLYWEQVYAEHVDELPLYEKRFEDDGILEFDSVAELEEFDPEYIKFNDIQMTKNIIEVLNCSIGDIHKIKPLEKGYMNKSFSFTCRDKQYVYRTPLKLASEFINRSCEKSALEIAKTLGIDNSFIYIDPNQGWKISDYIVETEKFDFNNTDHLIMLCNVM